MGVVCILDYYSVLGEQAEVVGENAKKYRAEGGSLENSDVVGKRSLNFVVSQSISEADTLGVVPKVSRKSSDVDSVKL